MNVARISRPQLLDASLRSAEDSVHVKAVSVGRQLRRDPDRQPHERLRQRLSQPEGTFEVREAHYFDLLAHRRAAARALRREEDARLGQPPPERLASVGEVAEEPPRHASLLEVRLPEKFFDEEHLGRVGGAQLLVGEGNPVGRAQEVQLHPVDGERPPPAPRRALEARDRLFYLPGMQHAEQRPIGYERLGISGQLLQELAPQGFEEAPELPHAPMERRGSVSPDSGEEVREEPLAVAQKRPLGLHAAELLQKRQGQDLGVREPLQGFVEAAPGVEEPVGVIGETKKRDHGVFRSEEAWGSLGRAIRGSFRRGFGWPPVYLQSMQHSSRESMSTRVTVEQAFLVPKTSTSRSRSGCRARRVARVHGTSSEEAGSASRLLSK